MIRVCSGWSDSGAHQYGGIFLRTFDKYWPSDVELQVFTETPEKMPRDACMSLWDIPGARECEARYDNPRDRGKYPTPAWKDNARAAGYNFKFDAFKFFRQLIIPQAASVGMDDGDILIWLDGDVETRQPVPQGFVENLIGDADVCFLGREPKHSEIGFWAVRISDVTRQFLADIADIYVSGAVLELKETHSAFAWDHCRKRLGIKERDLTPGGKGHVFPKSALGSYLIHNKGARKDMVAR